MNPSTTKAYYEGVPDKLVKPLLDFRADVPLQSTTISDATWTYYTLGNPSYAPLLLLHGGGGNAETMFQHIRGYADNFYVVAPNIPHNLTTISDVVVGLRALLGNLNITRANVVGMSFGAMLAQMYIRRFMDTVHNLVITHTMIPSQHMSEPIQMRVGMLTMYPEPLLLWMSKRSYFNDLPATTTPASPEKIAFWRAYFDELYSEQMTKRQIIARTKLTANYHVEYEFTGRDLKGWEGQLLIIESEHDQAINEGDRGSLKGMYSKSYVQTLYGYDHFAPLFATNEMIESITNFLHRFSAQEHDTP